MQERLSIKFTKMHGAGNDYIYIEALDMVPEKLPLLAKEISSRHFGVGSDGLVAIMRSDHADFRMRMFNADGSEAQMCGNASRCIGKYVYERGLTNKTTLSLETLAGIKELRLNVGDGEVKSVEVDMGKPTMNPEEVPVMSDNGVAVIERLIEAGGREFKVTAVGMGNPHGVIFTNELTDEIVVGCGPLLEEAAIWPEKANIEFAEVVDRNHIRMRVWERGSGETLACGTGACACVAAAVSLGLTDRDVELSLPGGKLRVRFDEESGHIFLSGGAEFIADGVYYYRMKQQN